MTDHWDKVIADTGVCVQEFVEQEVRPLDAQLDDLAVRIDSTAVVMEICEDMISSIASAHSDTSVDDPVVAAEFAVAWAQARPQSVIEASFNHDDAAQ